MASADPDSCVFWIFGCSHSEDQPVILSVSNHESSGEYVVEFLPSADHSDDPHFVEYRKTSEGWNDSKTISESGSNSIVIDVDSSQDYVVRVLVMAHDSILQHSDEFSFTTSAQSIPSDDSKIALSHITDDVRPSCGPGSHTVIKCHDGPDKMAPRPTPLPPKPTNVKIYHDPRGASCETSYVLWVESEGYEHLEHGILLHRNIGQTGWDSEEGSNALADADSDVGRYVTSQREASDYTVHVYVKSPFHDDYVFAAEPVSFTCFDSGATTVPTRVEFSDRIPYPISPTTPRPDEPEPPGDVIPYIAEGTYNAFGCFMGVDWTPSVGYETDVHFLQHYTHPYEVTSPSFNQKNTIFGSLYHK